MVEEPAGMMICCCGFLNFIFVRWVVFSLWLGGLNIVGRAEKKFCQKAKSRENKSWVFYFSRLLVSGSGIKTRPTLMAPYTLFYLLSQAGFAFLRALEGPCSSGMWWIRPCMSCGHGQFIESLCLHAHIDWSPLEDSSFPLQVFQWKQDVLTGNEGSKLGSVPGFFAVCNSGLYLFLQKTLSPELNRT